MSHQMTMTLLVVIITSQLKAGLVTKQENSAGAVVCSHPCKTHSSRNSIKFHISCTTAPTLFAADQKIYYAYKPHCVSHVCFFLLF